jgi:hypothetical protein
MSGFVSVVGLVLATAFPLMLAGLAIWDRSAGDLSTLLRASAVVTFVSVSCYLLVPAFVESTGARIDEPPGVRLEFAVGAVALTLAVLLCGIGVVAVAAFVGHRLKSPTLVRRGRATLAAAWLVIVYLALIRTAAEEGFDVCLPPGTEVGGVCESSAG